MIGQAFILAAGLGVRLRPLTGIIPKPLLPLAGKPLLEIFLDHLAGLGITRAGINLHHRADLVSAFLQKRTGGPDLTLFHEQDRILGTGGGLGQAGKDFGQGPLLVVSPKLMFDFDLREVMEDHQKSGASVTMVLLDRPGYNRVLVKGGRIVGFREDQVPGADRLAYTSVQVVEPAVFGFLPADGPGDLIESYREMIRAGHFLRAHVLPPKSLWLNLADLEDYLEFHYQVLIKGRPLFGHCATGPVLAEDTARVSPRARVEGFAYLGHGVKAGEGVLIRDSVVLDGAVLEPGAELVRAVAGPGVRIRDRVENRAAIA